MSENEPHEQPVLKITNKFAAASIATGILGLIFSPLCIVAVICGIVGLFRASKVNSGKALSIIGLILGTIALGLWPLRVYALQMERRVISHTNFVGIGKSLELYESAYQMYPDRLGRLVEHGYASNKMFIHPEDGANDSYIFILPVAGMPEDTIIGYENARYAYKGNVLVLLLDGRVIEMPIEELKTKLAEQKAKRQGK